LAAATLIVDFANFDKLLVGLSFLFERRLKQFSALLVAQKFQHRREPFHTRPFRNIAAG
jgi:hypothetical protein